LGETVIRQLFWEKPIGTYGTTRWWPQSIAKLVYSSNNYGL
jgi:hypothetical protein